MSDLEVNFSTGERERYGHDGRAEGRCMGLAFDIAKVEIAWVARDAKHALGG